MKLVLKNTHVNVEISPEDIPAEVCEALFEAIHHGWPVKNDIIVTIIRNCWNSAHSKKKPNNSPHESVELIKIEARGH
jgi:hypothetical protein